jgi:hypothetical protein
MLKLYGVILLATMPFSLSAGTTAIAQQRAPGRANLPATAPSFQGYGDQNATCLAWTDGCRTCLRVDKGVNCSNIGIACQPAEISCTVRQEQAK